MANKHTGYDQKLVFIMGHDFNGGFSETRALAEDLQRQGKALIITPDKATDPAAIGKLITEFSGGKPTGVVIASHGEGPGFIYHSLNDNPVSGFFEAYTGIDVGDTFIDYEEMFKNLPDNVKEVMVEACYGGTAMEAAKHLPPGSVLYSDSAAGTHSHNKHSLKNALEYGPKGLTVSTLFHFTRQSSADGLSLSDPYAKEGITNARSASAGYSYRPSHRIAFGGPDGHVVDLDKEIELRGKNGVGVSPEAVKKAAMYTYATPDVAKKIASGEPLTFRERTQAYAIIAEDLKITAKQEGLYTGSLIGDAPQSDVIGQASKAADALKQAGLTDMQNADPSRNHNPTAIAQHTDPQAKQVVV